MDLEMSEEILWDASPHEVDWFSIYKKLLTEFFIYIFKKTEHFILE